VPPEESVVLVYGPWTHRDVTAGGLRFHVAEAGPADGPLVLLLHGFPEFWWSWRAQLVALGAAGFHAVAPDLRGYGGSDKPPRGYDAYTLAADVAGLVRALGHHSAHLVGHDWGGLIGWTTATLHPRSVSTLTVLSVPHPLRMRSALGTRAQARASAYVAGFQLPRLPERRLREGDLVSRLLRDWGGPGFPDDETDARCREALAVPAAAHCALEYYRWAVRSQTRPEGRRYREVMARGVAAPVLHLHGAVDRCVLPSSVVGSSAWARGTYELRVLAGVGHFPHEEVPQTVTAALLAHAGA
jgi:pimeloyl-ACP methyl ester carboxylesterase